MKLLAALQVVCLTALLAASGCREEKNAPAAAPAKASAGDLASQVGQPVGDATAKVQVVAVLPVQRGCQDVVGIYLLDTARANPTMLSAKVLDMKSDEGQSVLKEHDHTCLSIFVNDNTKFDLGEHGGKFMLEGPLDYNYTMTDLRNALASALKAAYGDKAPQLPPAPASETAKPASQVEGTPKGAK